MVISSDNNELEKSIDFSRRNDQRVSDQDRFDGKSKIIVVPVNPKNRLSSNFDVKSGLFKISQPVPHKEKNVKQSDPC